MEGITLSDLQNKYQKLATEYSKVNTYAHSEYILRYFTQKTYENKRKYVLYELLKNLSKAFKPDLASV